MTYPHSSVSTELPKTNTYAIVGSLQGQVITVKPKRFLGEHRGNRLGSWPDSVALGRWFTVWLVGSNPGLNTEFNGGETQHRRKFWWKFVWNYLKTPLLVQALRENHEFQNQQMAYTGRRHPHAKVQSVPSKKTGRRYRGLNSGPSHAKRRLSRLSYRAVVWSGENSHSIGFVKSWIVNQFGTVCPVKHWCWRITSTMCKVLTKTTLLMHKGCGSMTQPTRIKNRA